MEIKYYSGYKGLNTLLSPRQVPDDYVIDCSNVIFRDGCIKRRWGLNPTLEPLPITDYTIRHVVYFNQFYEYQKAVVCITDKDIWLYDQTYALGSRWRLITPRYITGTASATNGSTVVTGSGTSWSTLTGGNGIYEIKFGSTDPNASGTWYKIATFNSNTSLTLLTESTQSYSGVAYCIRMCLSGGVVDYTIAHKTDGTRMVLVIDGSRTIKYTGSGYATDVTGVNPSRVCGFFGSVSGEHFIIGNTTDTAIRQPMTIEISDIGDPESFANGDYIDLMDTNDEIVGFRKIRDNIAVYKRHSISLLAPSYSTSLFNVRQNVVNGIGAINNRVIADCNNYHIFLGETNVYAFDGVNIVPIADEIKNRMFSDINWDYIHRAFAFYDSVHDLFMLFLPTGSRTEANICYVYDVITKAWTVFNFGYIITSAQEIYIPFTYSWDDVVAAYTASGGSEWTWNWMLDNRITWNSLQGGVEKKAIMFTTSDGKFLVFDEDAEKDFDIPIRAYVLSKDYYLNEPYKLASVGDLRIYCSAIDQTYYNLSYVPNITVKGSMNYGYEYSQNYLVDISGNYGNIIDRTVSFALRGSHFRFYIGNTTAGEPFSIEGVAINYNDAGV